MKLVLNDPFLGRRELDPLDNVAVIKDQLNLLRKFQELGTSPNPAKLADDIRAYEILLGQDDPKAACDRYMSLGTGRVFNKKKALEEMGLWTWKGAP